MSSNRRVRFAEDYRKSFDHADLTTAPQPVRALEAITLAQPRGSELVESQLDWALETSRTEQLENSSLAAQRAHDAVMLARSMQAEIQSSNVKLRRCGQGAMNQGAH